MTELKNRKYSIFSMVLYSLAGLLMLYTIWAIIHNYRYISEMIANQQLIVQGNEFDIVNFYMTNSAQYALFAVILFTLGWLVQAKNPDFVENVPDGENKATGKISEKVEEDFEEWFKNNKD